MTACSWCGADVDREMPNRISPHATWCPHYRKPPPPPNPATLAEMAAYATRQTKAGIPTFVTPENKCLACGYAMNMARGLSSDTTKPGPGDVSVCLNCGHLMGFNPDLTLRELSDEEAHDIAGDKDLLRAQAARAATRRPKK